MKPAVNESYLDLTAGYGGHAEAILNITKAPQKTVLVDQDGTAVEYLKKHFQKLQGIRIWKKDFYSASKQLVESGEKYDLILADLGLSSLHLDKAKRGFSFKLEGPLDMRMDLSSDLTAAQIVNHWNEKSLADLISRYGEEPKAKKIAYAIVRNRPLKSTSDLANVILRVFARSGKKFGRIHPATKSFQAIRIAVNKELDQLEKSLPLWVELLAPSGRLAVISFHSLEDRLVKQILHQRSDGLFTRELKLLTKKPTVAVKDEFDINPRARSAKLRAAVKIKTKKGVTNADSGKRSLQSLQSTR